MRTVNPELIAALLLSGACLAAPAQAADADQRAAYNQGVDLYGRGDYNKAAESFQEALNTDNRRLEAWTNYNLGNARFEQSQAAAGQQPGAGIAALKEALLFFKRALDIDPQDQNAKYNYELTQQQLKQMEQQSQQQEKQEQQGKQDKQKEPQQNATTEGPEKRQQDAASTAGEEAAKEEEKQAAAMQQEKPAEKQPGQEKEGTAAHGNEEQQEKMTPQEALMLLDNFQRQEKMTQQLVAPERRREETPPGKDW